MNDSRTSNALGEVLFRRADEDQHACPQLLRPPPARRAHHRRSTMGQTTLPAAGCLQNGEFVVETKGENMATTRLFGLTPEQARLVADGHRLHELYDLRNTMADSLFEFEAYADPDQDLAALYNRIHSKYLGVDHGVACGLSIPCTAPILYICRVTLLARWSHAKSRTNSISASEAVGTSEPARFSRRTSTRAAPTRLSMQSWRTALGSRWRNITLSTTYSPRSLHSCRLRLRDTEVNPQQHNAQNP
jgi:hypothetical protein